MKNARGSGLSRRRTLGVGCAAALAVVAGSWTVAQAYDNDPATKEPLRVNFRDIAPRNKEEAKKLKGAHVSGSVVVTSMNTDPANPNMVLVKAVENAPKIAGAYMRVQQDHWLRVNVTFTVDQQTSWALGRGESVSLSGNVATVQFSPNQNFATNGRGHDNLVLLGLTGVRLGIID